MPLLLLLLLPSLAGRWSTICTVDGRPVSCDAPCAGSDGHPVATGRHAYAEDDGGQPATARTPYVPGPDVVDGYLSCEDGLRNGELYLQRGGEEWYRASYVGDRKHGDERIWLFPDFPPGAPVRLVHVVHWEEGREVWEENVHAPVPGRGEIRYHQDIGPDDRPIRSLYLEDGAPLQGRLQWVHRNDPDRTWGWMDVHFLDGKYHGETTEYDGRGCLLRRSTWDRGTLVTETWYQDPTATDHDQQMALKASGVPCLSLIHI